METLSPKKKKKRGGGSKEGRREEKRGGSEVNGRQGKGKDGKGREDGREKTFLGCRSQLLLQIHIYRFNQLLTEYIHKTCHC